VAKKAYKALSKQVYSSGQYSIAPIRIEDRFDIMRWRNDQIYHLRQNKPLTKEDQDKYFEDVVSKLFEQDTPDQILFSYLEGEKCIGYGGLVHINWIDRNAEISFIMNPSLEADYFELHWRIYLSLLEIIAFEQIGLHKIYTYAYDLRPKLYDVLINAGYRREAVLKQHLYFLDKFVDIIIHSKFIDEFKK
jgi:RimJ/RimL family protein N-acetyltransferase